MKFIKKVYGCDRPQEYIKNWANFETKVELEVGDLVALDTDGKLIKATHENRPIGVATMTTPKMWGEAYQFTGERDANKLAVGSNVHCYRYFLVSGVELQPSEWTSVKIGDPIYLGDSGLTKTKPESGFIVGTVERVGDQMVRFNLDLTVIDIAGK